MCYGLLALLLVALHICTYEDTALAQRGGKTTRCSRWFSTTRYTVKQRGDTVTTTVKCVAVSLYRQTLTLYNSILSNCTSQTRASRAYCKAKLRTAAVSALARVFTKPCLCRLRSARTAPRDLRLPSGLIVIMLSAKKAGTQKVISSASSISC
jgi:hypothetical protein